MRQKKNQRPKFVVALALIAALLIAYVPAPESFAAPPPYVVWPDASVKGKAKTMRIGNGLKVKPVKFFGKSDNALGISRVYFNLKLTGKATKQGIYVLALYYKGRKLSAGTDVYGMGHVSFGVVRGKVNTSKIHIAAMIQAKGPIDRSKIKVKRVKFIPGYSLDMDRTVTKAKYNGFKIRIVEIGAPGETKKAVKARKSVNGKKSLYIVKKNAPVRFYAQGYSPDDTGAEQTGMIKISLSVNDKTVSGNILTMKGEDATGYISPPIPDTDYPDNRIQYPKNWRTSSIKITKDTTAKIKSVEFTPFDFHVTGAAAFLPVG